VCGSMHYGWRPMGTSAPVSGAVVSADLQRPLAGRRALIIDDVIDTGLSLSEAHRLVRDTAPATF